MRSISVKGLIVVNYMVAIFSGQIEAISKSYDGYVVLCATPNTEEDVQYLRELENGGLSLDFWQPPTKPGQVVDILVPPERIEQLKFTCQSLGINCEIMIHNVQDAIKAESPPARFGQSDETSTFRVDEYHDYPKIENFLRKTQSENDDIVILKPLKIRNKGSSHKITHERRPIWVLKIGKAKSADLAAKPAIWIDGGIHAREWISPATALYFIHRLITDYKNNDPQTVEMLETIDFYIAPVLNPDGYQFSRTTDRMWRKNRRPSAGSDWNFGGGFGPSSACSGVDLNRNFDWYWATSGASPDECKNNHHGPFPFSEPETQAIRDFFLLNKAQIKAAVTMHSYGQIWMYPYGQAPKTYPKDKHVMVEMAKKAVEALGNKFGTVYKVGTGADELYPASGSSLDWFKGVAKVKFSYLLELQPRLGRGNGFLLPADRVRQVGEETWEGVKVIVKETIRRYSEEKENTS